MKYNTSNLDITTALLVRGEKIKSTKRFGLNRCDFEFRLSEDGEKTVREFWAGTLNLNLASFLSARYALKVQTSGLALHNEKKQSKELYQDHPMMGKMFWVRVENQNVPSYFMYRFSGGPNQVKAFLEGRAYGTELDAKNKTNPLSL